MIMKLNTYRLSSLEDPTDEQLQRYYNIIK